MSSIVTITFNPAIDKSLSIAAMVPDKKLKCSQAVCKPGGGGINVARAIKKLGGEAVAVYLSGGDTGKKITHLLAEDLIECIAIHIKESTRENLVVVDESSKKQYLFDMPGPEVSEEEWNTCLHTIEGLSDVEYIVASGSLPPGVPNDIFAKISLGTPGGKLPLATIYSTSDKPSIVCRHVFHSSSLTSGPGISKRYCFLLDSSTTTRFSLVLSFI